MNDAQICILLGYGAMGGFGVGFAFAVLLCGRRVRKLARSFCRNCGCPKPHLPFNLFGD